MACRWWQCGLPWWLLPRRRSALQQRRPAWLWALHQRRQAQLWRLRLLPLLLPLLPLLLLPLLLLLLLLFLYVFWQRKGKQFNITSNLEFLVLFVVFERNLFRRQVAVSVRR